MSHHQSLAIGFAFRLTDLPSAILELILSYVSFRDLGIAIRACHALFGNVGSHAAQSRARRLALRVPASDGPHEPWLMPFDFAEALSVRLAEAPSTISAGEKHSLVANAAQGVLYTWGSGIHLGVEDEGIMSVPMPIRSAPMTIRSVSAGYSHSMALDADGMAWSWGYHRRGAMGHSLTRQDGLVPAPRRLETLGSREPIGQVACGEAHTLFLSLDGRVWSCGDGLVGRLGHGDHETVRTPKLIEFWQPPNSHALGSLSLERLKTALGAIDRPGGSQPGGPSTSASSSSSSTGSSLRARAAAGALELPTGNRQAINDRHFGVFGGACPTPPRVICVSAGEGHSLAVTARGHIYSWGLFSSGRLGVRKTTIDAADFPDRSKDALLPLHADAPPGVSFIRVCAGEAFSLAVDSHRCLWSWGRNTEGQLGLGDERTRWRPCRLATGGAGPPSNSGGDLAGRTVRCVAAGTIHAAAIDLEGRAYTWGVDAGGRLGQGEGQSQQALVPRLVSSLLKLKITEVSVARYHSLFLSSNGVVLACGRKEDDVLGLPNLTLDHAAMPEAVMVLEGAASPEMKL